MGLKLVRVEAYSYETKVGNYEFIKGQEYHDLPKEIETYLLQLGYFHYIPTPNRVKPANIARIDRNYKLRDEGKITVDGRIINNTEEEVEAPKKKKPQELDLYLDDDGTEIVRKKGQSVIDNLDEEADVDGLAASFVSGIKEAKSSVAKKGKSKRGK